MSEIALAPRIVASPDICGGRARIEGTRVPVSDILSALAAGESADEIVEALPYLTHADIDAALKFAADRLEAREVFAA
jgi:uncharacterized protein (DUF433 family)